MAFNLSVSVIILLMAGSELILSDFKNEQCTLLYVLSILWFQIFWLQTKCSSLGIKLSKFVSAALFLILLFKATVYLLSLKREEE